MLLIILTVQHYSAIKKRMEKDIDEVGKIARSVKGKLEVISRDVMVFSVAPDMIVFCEGNYPLSGSCTHFLLFPEHCQSTKAWL